MSCCLTDAPTAEASLPDTDASPAPRAGLAGGCVHCGAAARPVTRKTVLLMLKPALFDRVSEGEYRFCASAGCRVVYFTVGGGSYFTTEDMRVRVGLKEKDDSAPLCYCFGFDERDAREEIAAKGRCTIPERVAALVRQRMCACAERNPSGACCLPELVRVVKRLTAQADSSS